LVPQRYLGQKDGGVSNLAIQGNTPLRLLAAKRGPSSKGGGKEENPTFLKNPQEEKNEGSGKYKNISRIKRPG